MLQIFKVLILLLPNLFSEKNFLIFLTHVKLFFASFIHHQFKKNEPEKEKQINIIGYKISFYNYPILINQFEEIFIYKSYHFESNKDSPIIFDCGSNIGISILYFKNFHPASRIIAFEPDPENFRLLKKNIEQNNFSEVILHNCALGKEDGSCQLFNTKAGQSSLNSSIYSNGSEGNFIEVSMKKLSTFITEEIDFLKMDVEGAEGEIIPEISEAGKLSSISELVIEYHLKSNLPEDKLILIIQNSEFALISKKQFGGTEKVLKFKRK